MYKEEQVHFEKLIQKIQKPDFQRNQGLSNEVGYIFTHIMLQIHLGCVQI